MAPNVFVPLGRWGLRPSDDVEPFASGAPPNYSWWICTPTCGVPVWRRLCLSAGRWHKSWGPTWCSRPAPIHHRGDGGRWFPRQPLLPVSAPGRSVPRCWAHKVTVLFFQFSINGNTTLQRRRTSSGTTTSGTMAFGQDLTDSLFLSRLASVLCCIDFCSASEIDAHSKKHETHAHEKFSNIVIQSQVWRQPDWNQTHTHARTHLPLGGGSTFANVNFMSFFKCNRNVVVAFEDTTKRERLEHIAVQLTQSHQQGSDSPTSNTDVAPRHQRSSGRVSWWLFHLWRLWIEKFKAAGSHWN